MVEKTNKQFCFSTANKYSKVKTLKKSKDMEVAW